MTVKELKSILKGLDDTMDVVLTSDHIPVQSYILSRAFQGPEWVFQLTYGEPESE